MFSKSHMRAITIGENGIPFVNLPFKVFGLFISQNRYLFWETTSRASFFIIYKNVYIIFSSTKTKSSLKNSLQELNVLFTD